MRSLLISFLFLKKHAGPIFGCDFQGLSKSARDKKMGNMVWVSPVPKSSWYPLPRIQQSHRKIGHGDESML